jgi:hypothetical protein
MILIRILFRYIEKHSLIFFQEISTPFYSITSEDASLYYQPPPAPAPAPAPASATSAVPATPSSAAATTTTLKTVTKVEETFNYESSSLQNVTNNDVMTSSKTDVVVVRDKSTRAESKTSSKRNSLDGKSVQVSTL